MKNLFKMLIVTMSMFVLTACGSVASEEQPSEKISITHELGTTEVPLNAEKVVVLDFGAVDIMDSLGVSDKIVGMPKGSQVEYLAPYFENENILDLGSLKEINMEDLNSLAPDLIIIGGRQADNYEEFSKIAPTIYTNVDNTKGYMASFEGNLKNIAKVYGKTDDAQALLEGFNERIDVLKQKANGADAIIALVTKGSANTLGKESRGSIISKEIGFTNLTDANSTHGDAISFEYLLEKNPEYIFVLDRDTAISADGAKTAKEIIENDIVKKSKAYENGNIVYLTPAVWYLAEGGVQSTDIMLKDLENGILK